MWMAAAVWLSGACATSDRARDAAFVRDARECEEDADTQLFHDLLVWTREGLASITGMVREGTSSGRGPVRG